MKKILNFLMNNCITSTIVSIITYIFYGIVIGISMFPSIILIKTFLTNFKLDTILNDIQKNMYDALTDGKK